MVFWSVMQNCWPKKMRISGGSGGMSFRRKNWTVSGSRSWKRGVFPKPGFTRFALMTNQQIPSEQKLRKSLKTGSSSRSTASANFIGRIIRIGRVQDIRRHEISGSLFLSSIACRAEEDHLSCFRFGFVGLPSGHRPRLQQFAIFAAERHRTLHLTSRTTGHPSLLPVFDAWHRGLFRAPMILEIMRREEAEPFSSIARIRRYDL